MADLDDVVSDMLRALEKSDDVAEGIEITTLIGEACALRRETSPPVNVPVGPPPPGVGPVN